MHFKQIQIEYLLLTTTNVVLNVYFEACFNQLQKKKSQIIQ